MAVFAGDAEAADSCAKFAEIVEAGVPEDLLRQAITYYDGHPKAFAKAGQLAIADYSRSSTEPRFFFVDLAAAKVESFKVSHGSGDVKGKKWGDADHDGMLDRCVSTKRNRQNMTRPGFFVTRELYYSAGNANGWPRVDAPGKFNALRMDGLSPGINGDAMARGVVMHGAEYNRNKIMGRSYGCPAFEPEVARKLLPRLAEGVLFFASAPMCKDDMTAVLAQVPTWKKTCTTTPAP